MDISKGLSLNSKSTSSKAAKYMSTTQKPLAFSYNSNRQKKTNIFIKKNQCEGKTDEFENKPQKKPYLMRLSKNKNNSDQDRFTLGFDHENKDHISDQTQLPAWRHYSESKNNRDMSLSDEECEENIQLSGRSSIHKIMSPTNSNSTMNKYDTGPCKFISEINCDTVLFKDDAQLKSTDPNLYGIKLVNSRASRNEYSIIMK